MHNLRSLSSSGHTPIHPSDPDQTGVSPSYDPGVTSVKPTHTEVIPPTHTNLSRKQALVLDFLAKNISRQTNYNAIGLALGITKSSARDAVLQLVSKKYISPPVTIRDGVFQGFEFRLDGVKCQQFLEAGGASNEKYHVSNQTVTLPPHTVRPLSATPYTHSSSNNLDSKLTTDTVDLCEPELLYWVEQGLTEKQINTWLTQFQMRPEDLSQSLRFARFDFVENKKEKDSKGDLIESFIGYFFGVLTKAGRYARPTNYKSILELRAEELKDQQQRDDEAKKKIWEFDIDEKFREVMTNRESSLYLELFALVGEFERENPFALEIKMKELLKERHPMVHSKANYPVG